MFTARVVAAPNKARISPTVGVAMPEKHELARGAFITGQPHPDANDLQAR